jgi:hypothetical protein
MPRASLTEALFAHMLDIMYPAVWQELCDNFETSDKI